MLFGEGWLTVLQVNLTKCGPFAARARESVRIICPIGHILVLITYQVNNAFFGPWPGRRRLPRVYPALGSLILKFHFLI